MASDLGLLVAIGGNNEAQAASRTVETFDLLAKDYSWTSRPEWNIPKEVNGHCSFYHAPHLYIIGGRHAGIEQPDTYRLDLSSPGASWELMASMFEGKAAMGCVLDPQESVFYVAGGGIDESAFSYDIAANTWTRMANLEQMRDGNGLGMVGNVLTTFGGRYF